MHKEEIKAQLRMRHGSLEAFERARGLSHKGVANLLQGRGSRPVAAAIAAELNLPISVVFPNRVMRPRGKPPKKVDTKPVRAARKREDMAVAS
jgi:lambda repressor-like predicted transcriptional regulator